MKRVITATCLAASFAVGLGAQSTGTAGTAGSAAATAQDPPSGQRGPGPRTVIGCLRAGVTAGTFMLTDVTMQGGRAGGAGMTAGGATAGGTGTAGTGTATSGTTAGAGGQGGGQGMGPMSIMLTTADSSIDLKAHVGHKIEVTGTMAGGRGRGAAAGAAGSTGTATGTTTATGTSTTGTAATGTTATGTTATGGTATATGTGQGGGRGPRNMTVTSVRMISESCS